MSASTEPLSQAELIIQRIAKGEGSAADLALLRGEAIDLLARRAQLGVQQQQQQQQQQQHAGQQQQQRQLSESERRRVSAQIECLRLQLRAQPVELEDAPVVSQADVRRVLGEHKRLDELFRRAMVPLPRRLSLASKMRAAATYYGWLLLKCLIIAGLSIVVLVLTVMSYLVIQPVCAVILFSVPPLGLLFAKVHHAFRPGILVRVGSQWAAIEVAVSALGLLQRLCLDAVL